MLIQAYYSPEVPREFVADQVRPDRPCSRSTRPEAAATIRLNLVPAELYSDEAREAEKRFGIEPKRVLTERPRPSGRFAEIILGVAFTSGLEEVVIPSSTGASPSSTS